ncbi:trypsin-like peptidase domain-containing protein [Streptomyces sp. NPDC049099]|uniref:trypsin-like peptidase domain-containing protein n=1 Tax=Streptomyces sp. NPDC049099 TaxID=3155768 RepID=UPI003421BC17
MNEGNGVPPEAGPEQAAGVTPAHRIDAAAHGTTDEDGTPGASGPVAGEPKGPAQPHPDSGRSGTADVSSGDFALARPVGSVDAEPKKSGSAGTAADGTETLSDGDFELARPTPSPAGGAEAGRPMVSGVGLDANPAVDGSCEQRESAWAAPAERPKPLHDPDPYGTPPYGEPGPWAPAPPVQHPATTSAQGTPVPTPTAPPAPLASAPAPETPAPATGAPAPAGSPASVGSVGNGARRYDPWAVGSPTEQVLVHGGLQQTGAGALTDKQRNRRAKRFMLVWTLVVALLSAGIGGVVGAYVEGQDLGGDVQLPRAAGVPAGRPPGSVAAIAALALPSVVTLHVTGTDQSDTGTGFVLDAQGHILTNNHVVAPAGSGGAITVTFSSGDTVKAKVVGRDSGYDLAVVQIHGVHGLTPLPLGNSDDVRVGDPVVAIGAPFDLANTVTAGIISAKERPITAGGEQGDGSDVSYVDALQTDAPINPGNSGGPLLDSRAQVIGINSAIRSADGGSDSDGGQAGSIGLGFAIPVNQAKRVAEELINDGHATHPVIGVTLDMAYTGDGARIDSRSAGGGPAVTRGGPGERAGLKPGDVITEVDGQRVHTAEELIVKIRAHRPGDRLGLTVRRDGADRQVPLRLGAAEQN